jgi:5-methyltetrahydropteroyltriglutamate--homocysteine methyltransferase
MAGRTSPPFRADHVGSLLRPPRLLAARDDFAAGRISAADLRAVEDEEIPGAIRMQEDAGLQSATDGEFRRATWHMDFIYALGGISQAPGNLAVKFTNPSGTIEWTPAALHVGSRVRLDDTIFGEDFTFLKSHVTTAVPKLTIPSPNMVHYRGGPAMLDPAVYPDLEEFWADLAAAYAEEVRRLAALGCRYLQFDDTSLAYLNDPAHGATEPRAKPGVATPSRVHGPDLQGCCHALDRPRRCRQRTRPGRAAHRRRSRDDRWPVAARG